MEYSKHSELWRKHRNFRGIAGQGCFYIKLLKTLARKIVSKTS
jgi:hypothetical protein